ncbi:MAG: choice-of-anchor D domain-containing protein, partial [Saprospiraceae bacterium]|nr:choice-of-anchor D domain-containing protein [Saprospiraceae bacterium]
CASGAGCTGTNYVDLATWNVVAQPSGPTLDTKTPNLGEVCSGTGVSATFNAGSGGAGCSDDYEVVIDGAPAVAYTPGTTVGTGATSSIVIRGRRADCASGAGCTGTNYVDLATWNVNGVLVGPTLDTKTPNLGEVCSGTGVSATFNAGSGGSGCSDEYEVVIDGAPAVAYTPGTTVGTGATSSIVIRGRRADCASGAGCTGTNYVDLASWNVGPGIDIRGNSVSIANGDNTPSAADHTNFGGTAPGTPIIRTFAVHNTGGQALLVSSILSSNNTDFALDVLMLASPILPGQSATFTVTFQASVQNTYTSTITINSNACNEAVYTFDILAAVDCAPPTITSCPSAQIVPAATNQCNAVVSYAPLVSGSPTPIWTYEFVGATSGSGSGTGSGAAFNVGATTVTLTATNSCGTSSCTFVVTANDTQFPSITCPPPTTVSCAGNVPAPNTALITATDNCSVADKQYVSSTPFNIVCVNRFQVLREYRATDGAGNSNTCSQVITVFDNTQPVFTFVPANVTVQCNNIPVVGTPIASDGCGGAVSVVYNNQTVSNLTCTDGYTLTRQWTATDACGNNRTTVQIIKVIDTQKPAFVTANIPANVTVQCDAIPAVGTPTATDNCATTVAISYIGQTQTSGSCPNAYTLTRRWVASDNCNNTRSISQRITVVDNGKPVITSFPANATIACNEAPPPVGSPTASDGCGSATVTYLGQNSVSGSCPGNYQIKRTWRATDACGNSTVATQTIQVSDTGVPVFTSVPSPITIECGDPLPPLVNPTASDACGGYAAITFLGNVPSGSGCAADYTVTRTWRAEDLCGNSATTTQVITVQGNSFGGPEPETLGRLRPMVTQMTRLKNGFPQINQEEEKSVEIRVSSASSAFPSPALGLQPNPTTDRIQLDLTDFAGEAVTVSIHSDQGQLIWERRIPAVEELKLPISLREAGAVAGMYSISVQSGSNVVAKRVVLVE